MIAHGRLTAGRVPESRPGWTGQSARRGTMWFRGRGKADRAIAAYQRELVDTHYREVENMYRQMRMWRHDYRNHLQTMKALDTPIKSGNAMADAILSSKMSLAQAHGIDVRVDAHIPIKLRISELDLCCVFGNLFDNAIEANDGLPEADRMIRVYMDMKGTQLYISFTNASSGGKQRKVGGASAPPNQTRGTVSGWSTSTRSSRLRAAT